MADFRRFAANDEIKHGAGDGNLNGSDVFPLEHMSDQVDKKIELRRLIAMPQLYASVESASDIVFRKIEWLNFKEFPVVLGQQFDITFAAPYANTTPPSISLKYKSEDSAGTISDLTLPIRAHGKPVGVNFNKTGSGVSSFHATIRTTATSATNAQTTSTWYLDLDSNVVSIANGLITYADGTTAYTSTQVNSALANYQQIIEGENTTVDVSTWKHGLIMFTDGGWTSNTVALIFVHKTNATQYIVTNVTGSDTRFKFKLSNGIVSMDGNNPTVHARWGIIYHK